MTSASPSSRHDYLAFLEERGRRLARRSLADFARYFAPPEYVFSWHHDLLYRRLDDFAARRVKRLIVQMPPGHGKSEGVSRNLPAYLLGRDPDARIIACSYTQDLASEMNRDVQRIMDGERYGAVFPASRLGRSNVRSLAGAPRRNADIFDLVGCRGYYKCAGVGGGITGRRFDFGVIDDPVKDREAANSPTQREAVWRWYTSVFSTRAARDASILLTLTRWHEDDLAGRLQRNAAGGGEPWAVLSLPALATGAPSCPEDTRRPGESLWPWFRSEAQLEAQRLLDPRDFAALYQQDPRAEGDVEWPASYFDGPGFWFKDWPDGLGLKVMALDPSKGADARVSDWQALTLYGRDRHGAEYVEADLGRRPVVAPRAPDGTQLAEGMVEHVVARAKEFGPECLAVETNQFQQLLTVPLRAAAREAGIELRIVQVDNRVNKAVRIRRLGEPLGQRRLRVRDTRGGRLLVEQLKAFPLGDHDDGPDSLEMARRTAIELHNGRQQRQAPRRVTS